MIKIDEEHMLSEDKIIIMYNFMKTVSFISREEGTFSFSIRSNISDSSEVTNNLIKTRKSKYLLDVDDLLLNIHNRIEKLFDQDKNMLKRKDIYFVGKSLVKLFENDNQIKDEEIDIVYTGKDKIKFSKNIFLHRSTSINRLMDNSTFSVERCYYRNGILYMTPVCLYDIIFKRISQFKQGVKIEEIINYLNRGYTLFLNREESDILREELISKYGIEEKQIQCVKC